jgi:hypothetical protein
MTAPITSKNDGVNRTVIERLIALSYVRDTRVTVREGHLCVDDDPAIVIDLESLLRHGVHD